jgi:hypothetical protein
LTKYRIISKLEISNHKIISIIYLFNETSGNSGVSLSPTTERWIDGFQLAWRRCGKAQMLLQYGVNGQEPLALHHYKVAT